MGGQIQTVAAPFRAHPAAPLRDEIDGVHLDQCAGVLRCLKLATSSLQSILPALDQAEAKITAVREMHETSIRQLLGIEAMFKEVIKAAMERRAPS
jgi:hypothetical protein